MGVTTNPDDGCLRVMQADGMQECYLVLSEEERAKGFVRPVRRSYVHLRCGGTTTMGQAIAETYARDPDFYGGTYCAKERRRMTYPYYSVQDIPNWKIYDNDSKNARIWFEGYCSLADSGIRLLDERDKLRAQIKRLRRQKSKP